MFSVETICGKPVSGGRCQGPISPNDRGNIVICGHHTGNVKNFWMVFRMGDHQKHKGLCALGQFKDGDDARHEFSILAPRIGKYEPYHGPGTLEFYLEHASDAAILPDEKPTFVVEFDEIVVESEDA